MDEKQNCSSRRDFVKKAGLGTALSVLVPCAMGCADAPGDDLDALAKPVTEGSPVRFSEAQVEDLKHEIEQVRKGVAKGRAFSLRTDIEPASIFRA